MGFIVRKKNTQIPTAPVQSEIGVNDALIEEYDAHTVELSFDKPCTGTSAGYTIDINASPATIVSVVGSGSNIFLFTILETLDKGHTVTVDYNSITGDTKSVGENVDLESFTGHPVTNNLAYTYKAYDYFESLSFAAHEFNCKSCASHADASSPRASTSGAMDLLDM